VVWVSLVGVYFLAVPLCVCATRRGPVALGCLTPRAFPVSCNLPLRRLRAQGCAPQRRVMRRARRWQWTALLPLRVGSPFSAVGLLQFVLRPVDTMLMNHRLRVLWSLTAATAPKDLVEHWLSTRRVLWCATPPSPTPLRHHCRPAPLSHWSTRCCPCPFQGTPLSLAETAKVWPADALAIDSAR